ncbi:precorrin-3B synthase [Nocardia vaccinii]|uniref:precorrin-3B synthase n=1 Tax=Nocardia vaccinii TaxID=1822 RepID=UPI0008318501|nr:precorrin-3B synthase [Nocardia vaccinii]
MTRSAPDSCPGVLRLHEAADGPLARIRVPGGRLRPDQLLTLAEAARDLGDGGIELTSRGNVQLRRIGDADALAARLGAADLLPSRTHERVRNIVASPLSGRVGGLADVRELIPRLDHALRMAPALADLPGRVLFTLDDGRGDVSGLDGDFGIHAVGADDYALLLGGRDSGVRVPDTRAVEVLLAAAHEFQGVRGEQWRLREVPGGPARILAALGAEPTAELLEPTPPQDIPIGWCTQDDGLVSLGAGVRLGVLPARTAEFLAAADRPVVVTPWRSLILSDLDEWTAEQVVRVLAPMGLIFDAASPWLLVTACAGQPGCARSRTDVRADAANAISGGRVSPSGTRSSGHGRAAAEIAVPGHQHWSGCERRCGRPRGAVTDVVAASDGYRITPPEPPRT